MREFWAIVAALLAYDAIKFLWKLLVARIEQDIKVEPYEGPTVRPSSANPPEGTQW